MYVLPVLIILFEAVTWVVTPLALFFALRP